MITTSDHTKTQARMSLSSPMPSCFEESIIFNSFLRTQLIYTYTHAHADFKDYDLIRFSLCSFTSFSSLAC